VPSNGDSASAEEARRAINAAIRVMFRMTDYEVRIWKNVSSGLAKTIAAVLGPA
jgi:hypothetical protein